jgi:protein-S-isoprenylcysteine O-methyltransferase Ste14
MEDNNQKNISKPGTIHSVISNSYIVFLLAVVLGTVFNSFIDFKILNNKFFENLGFVLIIIGPVLVYWAQKSSSSARLDVVEKGKSISFEYGPYKYTRNPSYLGVFIMILGLGFIQNSIATVFFCLVSYLLVRFIFIKKEEELLGEKYGQIYFDYKNKVRNRL